MQPRRHGIQATRAEFRILVPVAGTRHLFLREGTSTKRFRRTIIDDDLAHHGAQGIWPVALPLLVVPAGLESKHAFVDPIQVC